MPRARIAKSGTYYLGNKRIRLSRGNLVNMKQQFDQMVRDGINIPVTLGHSDKYNNIDPAAVRGKIESVDIVDNELFADVKFAKDFDHSIYKLSIETGDVINTLSGQIYNGAIRLVALTPTPVIPTAEFINDESTQEMA